MRLMAFYVCTLVHATIALIGLGIVSLAYAQSSSSVGVLQSPSLEIAPVAETNALRNDGLAAKKINEVRWNKQTDPLVNELLERTRLDLLRRNFTDAQIFEIQARLTRDLRQQGFLIGQIVISAKDRLVFEKTGELYFTIFLGNIGQIVVKNTSAVNTAWVEVVADNTLCPYGVGNNCVVTKKKFERMTQLLQDTVGLQTGALDFSAEGVPVGQTKLTIVTVAKDAQIKGSVGVDNQGFSSTGQYRLGTTLSANNLIGVGDVLALNLFVTNQASVSGIVEFSGPLTANGLRWQSSVSRSQFALPSYNNTNGFGNSLSAGVSYSLVRGLDENWTAGLNAVAVQTNSEIMGVNTTNKLLKSGQLNLDGNSGDRSITLGQDAWFVHTALTMGQVSDSANTSTSSYQPLGAYTKFAFQGTGKLILSDQHSIFSVLTVRGQLANTNLDPYERMMIGGYTNLRAYSVEQGSINQGTISSLELRKTINTEYGQFIPVIFTDYGNGWLNHATYPNWQVNSGYSNANLSNHMVASDAGLGLDWNSINAYTLSVSWARRLPSSPAGTYGNGNSQFWFVAQARF